jgi:hypothetical protein
MKTKTLLCWGLVGTCWVACGCSQPEKPKPAGFLSDYSHLRPETKTRSRYLPPGNRLVEYSQFIVDPVVVYPAQQTKAEVRQDGQMEELARYLHDALVKALAGHYRVVTTPGPGTARLRGALTQVKTSEAFSPGNMAIEAELLDAQTSEQLFAIREIQRVKIGSGPGGSADARRVMDDWARQFVTALEEQSTLKPNEVLPRPK